MKWVALVLVAGCAGRMGEIVTDPGDLSEGGTPAVGGVVELGGGDVVLTGDIVPAAGDGAAVIGEALWVKGKNFGRLPTVTIAGRPTAVLARTGDGGLVVRVPPAAPAGAQPLTVANEQGRGDFPLSVRRLVATLPPTGGRLALAELAAEGPRAAGEVAVAGNLLRIGPDGRAAYVLDPAGARVTVIELPAEGGPRAVFNLELQPRTGTDPVVVFAAAARAQALMLMRARDLVLLDTTSALHPARGQPRPLPELVQKGGVATAALSPDAHLVAVALEDGNRVVLLDVQHPGAASVCGELVLAPEARVPVLVDVAFAPDGRTLWVVLGDTAKSRAVGPQPTEIVAVRLGSAAVAGGPPVMTVARRVRIENAEAPLRLNTGRAIPLPSGASIRLPPERATVYLTTGGRGGTATVFRLGPEDRATPFIEVLGSAGAADLSSDGRWLLVPVVLATGRLVIVAAPADDRPGERRTVDLGPVSPRPDATHAGAGFALPSIAAQP